MSDWQRSAKQPAIMMGVLNCTPDSFSDGGQFAGQKQAIEHGLYMWKNGAGLIDVGGESTRPGAQAISSQEELQRVIPVIRALTEAGCRVSIDTMKAKVMQAALQAGACMINDVSALTADAAALSVAADSDAAICLMHMQGTPATMQQNPCYNHGVFTSVVQYFEQRLEACETAGIKRQRLILDPGIGFGKQLQDNLQLIAGVGELRRYFSLPVLLGVSRKSFIGQLTGAEVNDREWGTAAAVAIGTFLGADILRVHDITQQQTIAIASALADYCG